MGQNSVNPNLVSKKRGSYMSVHVLTEFIKLVRKRDQGEAVLFFKNIPVGLIKKLPWVFKSYSELS